MNPWEYSNLNLHDNYNPNLMLYPGGGEEIRHGNENFLRSVLVPPDSGSLESLVAQATFLSKTNNCHHQQTPPAVHFNTSSVPPVVYPNMPNDMPFINYKSSVPLVPASQLDNNLATTASSSADVKLNDTCYKGKEAAQLKVRKRNTKSKDQWTLMLAKQRRAAFLNDERRRQSINRSLNELLIIMSGTNIYKADTASMLERVANHLKLLQIQSKMANIMNIAPKNVALAIKQCLKMSMDLNTKSGSPITTMNSNNLKGENSAEIGHVDTDTRSSIPVISINKKSVVHPTTYVPSRQTIDPHHGVVAHISTPITDPIFAYLVAARKTEIPSVNEVAELTVSFEQLERNLDFN